MDNLSSYMKMLELNPVRNSKISKLGWIKIGIIVFVSFSLIANFIPYYKGADDMIYGISAIDLSEGSYGITNDLLQKTGDTMFVPRQWVKTIHETAIPIGSFGIYGIAAIANLIGGTYGLFYLGPLASIFLLILTERISTKLFGSLAGFITLIILASDWRFFEIGLRLLNDNIFSIFFIVGTFFLVKFFYRLKSNYILLSSIFFSIGTVFRINGAIIFPVEIFLVTAFLVLVKFNNGKLSNKFSFVKQVFQKNNANFSTLNINYKSILKISLFLVIPWFIFMGSWFGYNQYFFGDPTTNYEVERKTYTIVLPNLTESPSIFVNGSTIEILSGTGEPPVRKLHESLKKGIFNSLITFDSERSKWFQFFSVPVLPDTIKFGIQYVTHSDNQEDLHATNWMSMISYSILILGLGISILFRFKRTELVVFLVLILALLLFHSSDYIAPDYGVIPSGGLQERYMIPVSILSFMLVGYIVSTILKGRSEKIDLKKSNFKILKGTFLVLLLVLILGSFYIMPSVQSSIQTNFSFNNPQDFLKEVSPDPEGLTEESVIVGDKGRRTVYYGATHLFPYEGIKKRFVGTDPQLHPQEPIQMIKFLIENGYDVYTFRKDMLPVDASYFQLLESEHGIILKNYSKTFCKIELTNEVDDIGEIEKSDSDCFSDINITSPRVWEIRLKPPNEIFS